MTPDTKEPELLPCPFCGSTNIDPEGVSMIAPEVRDVITTWDVAKPEHIIHKPSCNDCGATSDNWNTRTPSPAPDDAERKAALELLDEASGLAHRYIGCTCSDGESGPGDCWPCRMLLIGGRIQEAKEHVIRALSAQPVVVPDAELRDAIALLRNFVRNRRYGQQGSPIDKAIGTVIKAALSAAPQAPVGGWRPIETYLNYKTVLLTNGDETIIGYLDNGTWSGGWYGSYAEVMEQITIDNPTHWQPLPPPPASAQEGE